MNNQNQQPRPILELLELINGLDTGIRNLSRSFSEYPARFEEMVTNNKFPSSTRQDQLQFLILKEKHHEFEHHLRTVKYELAMEKYRVLTNLRHGNPQRTRYLNIIEPLERRVQNILGSQRYTFCSIHQNSDGEEVHLFITDPQSGELIPHITKLANIGAHTRVAQERRHQQMHKDRVSALREELNCIQHQ